MTSSYSYSQPGYPKQIVYNGDTVVAITRQQMTLLNIAHTTWQQCTEVTDSLLVTIDSCSVAFKAFQDQVHNQQLQISIRDSSIAQRSRLISSQGALIASQKHLIKKLRVHKTLLAGTSVILAVVIIVIIL